MTLGGTGAAGHAVAVAVAALEREGEADAAGAGGQRAVGEAEVRVGLGEHERVLVSAAARPDRAGHVSATAEHGVRLALAQDAARGCATAGARLAERAGGLERVACGSGPRR